MKIIQHRANVPYDIIPDTSFAEIDVQIDDVGDIVVGHDLWGDTMMVEKFLNETPYLSFFIDIKQNLSVDKLQDIQKAFEGRCMGLFDVPFPSAYFARKCGLEIYGRLSDQEPLNLLFDKFWVDPLASQDWETFAALLSRTQPNHKLVIPSPELHGAEFDDVKIFWDELRHHKNFGSKHFCPGWIQGLVTKFPKEAHEFFGS